MKRLGLAFLLFMLIWFLTEIPSSAFAQQDKVRKSLKASVMQRLGVNVDITIEYSRPGVNGRKIWGELVPFGMAPGNKYSEDKPYPWRAGANENTTFETTTDLLVDGNKLLAGKYGIHMIPGEKEWVIIFSKVNDAWGSYSYDEAQDALRITVIPVKAAHREWLTYEFEDLSEKSATVFLHWEEIKVPFKIEIAKI